jgi:hypothetical protein
MTTEEQILRTISPFQMFFNKQKTITTHSRLQTENQECRSVYLKAHSTNSGTIYIGGADMTTDNATISLEAGEEAEIRINNVKEIWVLPTSSGDKINYSYIV